MLTHFERLWHIGIKVEDGLQRLAKLADSVLADTAFDSVLADTAFVAK